MDQLEILVPISFFLSLAAIFVLRGPIGKALADRLAGRTGHDDREVQELRGEIEELRHQVTEVQERLDFAERLLAREREAERLPPAR